MPSLHDHERRITTLETRVGEIEHSHGDSIYELKRMLRKHDLRWIQLFAHFKIQDVPDEAVDEALDQE